MQPAPAPVRSSSRPFPLPADIGAEQARSVFRAATAAIVHEIRGPHRSTGPAALLEAAWPGDRTAHAIISKAATAPAMTTVAGWASQLVPTTASDAFIASLEPVSAVAKLFSAAARVPLDGVGQVTLPFPAATPSLAPSVTAEGAPIAVRQGAFTNVVLGPSRKLSCIVALSNEIGDHSLPAAEATLRVVLAASAALALDQFVWSAAAGGLLTGSPITPTAGGGTTALLGDVKALLGALSAAGASRAMLFMPLHLMGALAVYVPGGFPNIEIVMAPSLASSNTVVAVDPTGVVSASDGLPVIDVGREATLHFEDVPLQLVTGAQGSGIPASPARNLYQSDSFSLRVRVPVATAARPGAIAHIVGVTW